MTLTWILITALGSWFAASVILGCALGRLFAGPARRRPAAVEPAAVSLTARRERVYGRPLRSVA